MYRLLIVTSIQEVRGHGA